MLKMTTILLLSSIVLLLTDQYYDIGIDDIIDVIIGNPISQSVILLSQ